MNRKRCLLLAVLVVSCVPSCRGPAQDGTPITPAAAPAPAPASEAALSEMAAGVRLLEQFQHAAAEARFARALELHPGWLAAQVNLAIAQLNQLEPESAPRAEASARAALALAAPGSARTHYVVGYVLAERQGQFADALPHFRRATELAPGDADAWFQRGRTAEEASRETDDAALRAEARSAYEKAMEIDPRSLEAHYRLGRLLLDSDDAADVARAEELLGEHARLIAGRPAIQPNYLTRGALALAHPWDRPQLAPAAPRPVGLVIADALPLPPRATVVSPEAPAAERWRAGLTIADVDGDSRLDLIAPVRDPMRPPIAWWAQESPRTFVPRQAMGQGGGACSTAAPGDLDGDGSLDAFVTCSTGNLVLLRKEGDWTNATPPDIAAPSFSAARGTVVDFDHDGDLDLHALMPLTRPGAGSWAADSLAWRNDGKAAFAQVAGALGILGPFAAEATLWTDFDLDNAVDLVAVVPGRLALLHADRDGPYRLVPLPLEIATDRQGPPVVDLETLDVDGDDDPDIIVLSGGTFTVLVNDSRPGEPSFRAASLGTPEFTGTALAVADLDLDGTRELLVLAPSEPLGSARGHLLSAGGVALPLRAIGGDGMDPEVLASADLDGDGAPDLALRHREGEVVLLWNSVREGSTWARLRHEGRQGRSNAQGFGAKVAIDAGSLHERWERRASQGSYCHVAAPEPVGLGGRPRLDGVTTLWPSGIQQGEADLAAGAEHLVSEVDRQPSSCPMLYGWDGSGFRFLTDCFDTAPIGLWVAPGMHWDGDPDEALRLRPGWVQPIDGVLNLSIAEFLNETLMADRVALVAVDHDAAREAVVDEAVRLAAPPQPLVAWLVADPVPVKARQSGRDVSAELRDRDDRVAGWEIALPWIGLAEPHALELELPSREGLLVLTGSLNFSNSMNLFAASHAGVAAQPARLEVLEAGRWRELSPDCGVPAGFHKDVVIDLGAWRLPESPRLRISTNLQVSWDRARLWREASAAPAGSLRELPLLRAEKRHLGIPREVKGPQDRWREFPRDGLLGRSPWIVQGGESTPDGDVRAEIAAADGRLAHVRPGEEVIVAFDDAALGAVAPGQARTHVLVTRGWVQDATPHTRSELVVRTPDAAKETR